MGAQGKLAEAEPLFREALEGGREVLGSRHPATMTSVGNLAFLLEKQGKLAEAEPLCREALEGKREVLGPRHPDTLTSVNNLAILLMDQGKLEEAEPLHREALEGGREVHGPLHPETLVFVVNLADCLRELGRLDEALAAEALAAPAVLAETLGPRHVSTLIRCAKAARIRHAQPDGAAAGAEELARVVAEMGEVLGAEHEKTRKYADVLAAMRA
jgi:tetratricopeptide (TPR) repeat protein